LSRGIRRFLDSFSSIGVKPKALEAYLGQQCATLSPAQLLELRGIYAAIRDGDATWADYLAKADEETARTRAADDLTDKIKGKEKINGKFKV